MGGPTSSIIATAYLLAQEVHTRNYVVYDPGFVDLAEQIGMPNVELGPKDIARFAARMTRFLSICKKDPHSRWFAVAEGPIGELLCTENFIRELQPGAANFNTNCYFITDENFDISISQMQTEAYTTQALKELAAADGPPLQPPNNLPAAAAATLLRWAANHPPSPVSTIRRRRDPERQRQRRLQQQNRPSPQLRPRKTH